MFPKTYDKEFIIKDLEIFKEYDETNFINNARFALFNTNSLNKKMSDNYYCEMLNKTISELENIYIDINDFNDVINLKNIDNFKINGLKLLPMDVENIRIQYLTEFTENIGYTIEKIINNYQNIDELINKYSSSDITFKVKKQIVKSSLPQHMSPMELMKCDNYKNCIIDTDYFKNNIIPFLKNFNTLKYNTIKESKEILKVICENNNIISTYIDTINNIKSEDNLSKEILSKLNYFVYNSFRSLMEIKSFVVYMVMRKINTINQNINICINICNEIKSYSDSFENKLYESISLETINPKDTESLSTSMIYGDLSPFISTSNNILEFHKGIISNFSNLDNKLSNENIEYYISNFDYDNCVYEEVSNIYTSIIQCLYIFDKNSEDYLLVFDDLLEKSGLKDGILDGYKHKLNVIDNLSNYNLSSLNNNEDLYFNILNEVMNFPENIKSVSNIIRDGFEIIENMIETLNQKANGEFKNTEAIIEINSFLDDLKTQYISLINTTSNKFMNRLVDLSVKLDSLLPKTSETSDKIQIDDYYDYNKLAYESIIDDIIDSNDIVFESLQKQFFIEKELIEKGVHVVFEEENSDTKVTVTDNNKETTSSSTKNITKNIFDDIKRKLDEWFKTLINKFNNYINNQKEKNLNWLKNNKDKLLNRSYTNCEANILPYENSMPRDNIVSDLTKLKNNISNLRLSELAGINDKEQLYSKLLSFISGQKITDTNAKDAISSYYKVGTNKLEVMTYKDGELKNLITQIIPLCESYYTSFIDGVMNNIEEINKTLDNTLQSYVTEFSLFDDNGFYLTEADENNEETSKTPSNLDKNNWIREIVKIYCGSILNAIRDRQKDYLLLLSKFVNTSTPTKNENNTNNNEPQNNEETNNNETNK